MANTNDEKYPFNGSFYTRSELMQMAQEQVRKGKNADMVLVKEFAMYHPYYDKYKGAECTCGYNKRDQNNCFILVVGDEVIPISYRTCIEGIIGERKRFLCYFRYAVRDQILEWKEKNKKPCMKCQSPTQVTADHQKPFIMLVNDFCDKNYPGMNANTIWDISEKVYEKMMNDFKKYHREHAVLQPLCAKCNQRKGSRCEN